MADTPSVDRAQTDYYAQAASFADELNRSNERAARVWMIIAGVLAILLGMSTFAIAALAPLRRAPCARMRPCARPWSPNT